MEKTKRIHPSILLFLIFYLVINVASDGSTTLASLPGKTTGSSEGTTGEITGETTGEKELTPTGKDAGVQNQVISIQDMKGKRTVSSAIVSAPANIGVPSFCFQRVDPGPCALDIVRVYYDYKTFTCKAFSYSGTY